MCFLSTMLLNFIRPIGNSTYKIYDLLCIKLDYALVLAISPNTNLDIASQTHWIRYVLALVDSALVLAISPNTNLDITSQTHWIRYVLTLWSLHFIFLRCQNYTTSLYAEPLWLIKKILMTPLCLWMKVTYFMLYYTETKILTTWI